MTRCDDIRPQLVAYVDNELADVDRQTTGDHLDGCVDCAAIVAGYRKVKAAAVADTAADDLWDAVAARIDETETMAILLAELRLMRGEMQWLRAEVSDLRRELANRPPAPSTRTSPFSFPDAPERALKQYRLV